MSIVKVQRKGQITIPNRLRAKIGLADGDYVEASVHEGRIILTPQLVMERSAVAGYTPTQRRAVDARLAKALDEVRRGQVHGPFDSVEEMVASIQAKAKRRKRGTVRSGHR